MCLAQTTGIDGYISVTYRSTCESAEFYTKVEKTNECILDYYLGSHMWVYNEDDCSDLELVFYEDANCTTNAGTFHPSPHACYYSWAYNAGPRIGYYFQQYFNLKCHAGDSFPIGMDSIEQRYG
jgi:hypothetical protein